MVVEVIELREEGTLEVLEHFLPTAFFERTLIRLFEEINRNQVKVTVGNFQSLVELCGDFSLFFLLQFVSIC